MRLGALIDGLGEAVGDVEVTGIATDSRAVRPGEAFFALPGLRTDGRRHVAEAVARGARAIVAEGEVAAKGSVPVVSVTGVRRVLARAAARLGGEPSAGLTLVGVTGTNGKTSTTFILEAIWLAAGLRAGVIGTVGYRFGGLDRPAPLTTPEAPVLQGLLAEMRRAGTTHVAMEVSSHALAQERVVGCRFDAAVFTNLTRDHLDFHGDVERYYRAKAGLFLEHLAAGGKPDPVAVVNVDDPAGARLADEVRTRCLRVGRTEHADVRSFEIETTLAGTRGVLSLGGRRLPFRTRLVGAPQVENILGAAAAAWALGVPSEAIAAGLAAVAPPPGRLERFDGPGFTVMVDYAHTPDALARVLAVLRPLTRGRLVVVFGCGGDRDPGKRPMMGEAAARLSDVVVLTSDNPRTEDPLRILEAIEAGIRRAGMPTLGRPAASGRGYLVEPDRRAAIALATGLARSGDLVLVAGKGHEDYQIVGHEKRHLDDREEVRRALGNEDAGRLEERR
ncbi:MAG: UDP-N-acetylmuramoyl-L-alanyl-D-glutamate--2,6-diaminopimelate ligase [Deltaproteobacteria bacterium]|nr:MAG: UDP-N-acetylmuramoyl-L-alanyl-D-glutamate--2,6-diaminopimelate ligase [Deltaproteobacteria bacterium]